MFLGCVLAEDAINGKRSRVCWANASLLLVPPHVGLAHGPNLMPAQEFFRPVSVPILVLFYLFRPGKSSCKWLNRGGSCGGDTHQRPP